MVKNSIQAFAANKAFETCDKLFNYEIHFFGRTLYLKACDFIEEYLKDGNGVIWKNTLLDFMNNCFGDITEEKINKIIKQLCDNDILRESERKNMYKIYDEKR